MAQLASGAGSGAGAAIGASGFGAGAAFFLAALFFGAACFAAFLAACFAAFLATFFGAAAFFADFLPAFFADFFAAFFAVVFLPDFLAVFFFAATAFLAFLAFLPFLLFFAIWSSCCRCPCSSSASNSPWARPGRHFFEVPSRSIPCPGAISGQTLRACPGKQHADPAITPRGTRSGSCLKADRSIQSLADRSRLWTSCRPIEKLNRVHHRN